MTIQEQYESLKELKKEINDRMMNMGFDGIKSMILWLKSNEIFNKLKNKDNQLMYLDFAIDTWISEKKELDAIGIEKDFFSGISSLEELENKYILIMFAMLRIENDFNDDDCMAGINALLDNSVTGIALCRIIIRETSERKKIIVQASRYLKKINEYITALILLNEAIKTYVGDKDICLELADIYMDTNDYKSALKCLETIKESDKEIDELKNAIKKVII